MAPFSRSDLRPRRRSLRAYRNAAYRAVDRRHPQRRPRPMGVRAWRSGVDEDDSRRRSNAPPTPHGDLLLVARDPPGGLHAPLRDPALAAFRAAPRARWRRGLVANE